jgi:MFS transporter, DHA2 family, multidrug resistance protein
MKRWREQLQGLGIATLFVPVSQLAYSNLPKHKNNKASNLTNLFRNQGGSFGIAFVTTLLARRTQYHESVLVAHATPLDERYRQLLASLTNYFGTHGLSHSDAAVRAQAQAFDLLDRQATFLGFLDCFTALGWFVLMGVPRVFPILKFRTTGGI